ISERRWRSGLTSRRRRRTVRSRAGAVRPAASRTRFVRRRESAMSAHPAAVPLCDLHAQYAPLADQLEAAVARVLSSGQVILGRAGAALGEEVPAYCGASHGVACGSGTDAISLALHAMEIGPGDEVILPTFTFFATAGCVARTGARPVFVDVDPASFN